MYAMGITIYTSKSNINPCPAVTVNPVRDSYTTRKGYHVSFLPLFV